MIRKFLVKLLINIFLFTGIAIVFFLISSFLMWKLVFPDLTVITLGIRLIVIMSVCTTLLKNLVFKILTG